MTTIGQGGSTSGVGSSSGAGNSSPASSGSASGLDSSPYAKVFEGIDLNDKSSKDDAWRRKHQL